jgi:L-threonylcarbamoyladenylate synthase
MEIINEEEISKIITALENGAVLVCPTDTVYGLVCDAMNQNAVEKIFEIKNRERNKSLAVFVKDMELAKEFAEIDEIQEEIIKKSWPGVTTFVIRAKGQKLSPLVYKDGTIAMRAPNYSLIKGIFTKFKKPLAQTSANISGQPATTKIKEIISQFENQEAQPNFVVDVGDLAENNPSAIIDLTNENIKIIRK